METHPLRSAALRCARALSRLPTVLIELLALPSCAGCDVRLSEPAVFCTACAGAVVPCPRPRPGIVPLHAYGAFGGPLADAIRRMKYADRPDLAGPLGELLRHAARASRLAADAVIPVPLHPRRLADRRFNQAALLAARVLDDLAAPLDTASLVRRRNTPPQAGLDAARRAENLRGAFAIAKPSNIAHRRILLVDDVVTTGATVRACADVLYRAGAASVAALTVARVD